MGKGIKALIGVCAGVLCTYILLIATDKTALITAVVLIGTLIVAVFQDHIRRYFFYPELKLDFYFGPPDCHKTEFRAMDVNKIWVKVSDAYYFRFSLTNTGKSTAELCEVVLEKIYRWDYEQNRFNKIERWNPVNLKWAGADTELRTINPGRRVFCDIGFIISEVNPSYKTILERKFPFRLAAINPTFNQRHELDKGKYKIEVAIYCKNLKRGNILTKEFIIDHKEIWDDDEVIMFRDNIKIS